MIVSSGIKSAEMSAVVIRCGCSEKHKKFLSLFGLFHAQQGRPCPNPKATEDLGVIVRYDAQDS